jgi:EAL domain-containing protein (putative c-di-GMP-specific phosphodiesterase class I)
LNPISFVPVAEESDLIIKLGSHVLMRAAKDCAKWQAELPRTERPLFVSVNVSTKQLFKPESVQEIRHILGRNIVPRGALRLEITETLVMENPEQAIEVLETLRGAGAELALDDFGTGYSSLAYLQRFPFDTIKIDREIVRSSNTANGAAIMRSIVALTHELTKKVVAEGVESAEEATFLRGIGCEYAQGYHFGEPIPDRDVTHLLKMVRRSEKRLQPRGFFRPKIKSKKSDVPVVQPDVRVEADANGAQAAIAAAVQSKQSTLPVRAVRRVRQKPPVPAIAASPAQSVAPPFGLTTVSQDSAQPAAQPSALNVPQMPLVRETTQRPVPPPPMQQAVNRLLPPQPAVPNVNGNGAQPFAAGAETVAPPTFQRAPLSEALMRTQPPAGPSTAMPPTPPSAAPMPTMVNTGQPPPLPRPLSTHPTTVPQPDFSKLPPGVAASLARLAAGGRPPPQPESTGAVSDPPPAAKTGSG